MKRRFDGVARNWLPRWWTARSAEFGCRVAADHGRKKRPDHRRHLAGAGRTRNRGRPADRPAPGTQQAQTLRDRLEAVRPTVSPTTVGRLLKTLEYALHA